LAYNHWACVDADPQLRTQAVLCLYGRSCCCEPPLDQECCVTSSERSVLQSDWYAEQSHNSVAGKALYYATLFVDGIRRQHRDVLH
jgi:hypothetical protein